MKPIHALALMLTVVLLVGCRSDTESVSEARRDERAKLRVYTTSYPIYYFAERIGDDKVEVVFPAPVGIDPAHWSPDPETVVDYQGADLILLSGAGYESWIDRASLPRARLVDTAEAIGDRLIPLQGGPTHQHGPEGQHTHEGAAVTLWLDPDLAIEQARAIAKAFADARPAAAAGFSARLAGLEEDLRVLDRALVAATKAIGTQPLLFSHPVYAYLERRYGLNARSLHWEPDQSPSPAQWRELEALLARHPAQLMVWEAEPLAESRSRLASLGVGVVVFEPLGNRPVEGDWLQAMRRNAQELALGLRRGFDAGADVGAGVEIIPGAAAVRESSEP
jgi:zinc transport system substrate-binding protein